MEDIDRNASFKKHFMYLYANEELSGENIKYNNTIREQLRTQFILKDNNTKIYEMSRIVINNLKSAFRSLSTKKCKN